MTNTLKLLLKRIFLFSILLSFIHTCVFAHEPGYYQYDQKSGDVRVVGRIYHTAPGEVLVEVWARPRTMKPKVKKISLISPSGKIYSSSELENFPMSQVSQKRSKHLNVSSRIYKEEEKQSLWAMIENLLVSKAHASCAPGHVEDSGGGSGSDDGVSRSDAETFAAFGALAGIASGQKKIGLHRDF